MADGRLFSENTALYHNVTSNARRIIQETSGVLSTLGSGIEEQKTVLTSLKRRLDVSIGELTN